MGPEVGVVELAIGAGLLVAGIALGALASGAGRVRERLRALERELALERERHAVYQDEVAKHFGRTSDLFRDLTRQYTSLYAHLAEGARDLCADRLPALGRGFGATPLQAGSQPADPVAETEAGEAPEATPAPTSTG